MKLSVSRNTPKTGSSLALPAQAQAPDARPLGPGPVRVEFRVAEWSWEPLLFLFSPLAKPPLLLTITGDSLRRESLSLPAPQGLLTFVYVSSSSHCSIPSSYTPTTMHKHLWNAHYTTLKPKEATRDKAYSTQGVYNVTWKAWLTLKKCMPQSKQHLSGQDRSLWGERWDDWGGLHREVELWSQGAW